MASRRYDAIHVLRTMHTGGQRERCRVTDELVIHREAGRRIQEYSVDGVAAGGAKREPLPDRVAQFGMGRDGQQARPRSLFVRCTGSRLGRLRSFVATA